MLQIDSFRNRFMILFAGMAFTLGLSTTLYIGHLASAQLTKDSGNMLHVSAKNIANTFAIALSEREREIHLLAKSPFFMEAEFDWPQLQLKLDQVQDSYRYYAWLGIADPTGKVALAGKGLLAGADVSERPWFQAGLKQTYIGDVHDAVLLAKKIQAINPNEPLRLIDFSTPMYGMDGQLKGVLAAHADWSWSRQALENSLPEHAAEKGIEVFIVNAQGEILYPFKSIGNVTPPSFELSRPNYFEHDWGEQQTYLTTDVQIRSETTTNLGWHVIMRQPKAQALAEVKLLQQQILVMGLLISLILLWVTYRLANRFSQPIEGLAHAAHQVEHGQKHVSFDQKSTILEIQGLSQSLTQMTQTLLSQQQQLIEANATLEHKVLERTRALEQANLELEKLARHDGLTNIYNRRALNEHLDYLFLQFKRNQLGYCVLLMDVDFFKKVNDQFGHDVGDQVLKSVAQVLVNTVRESDFVARFGGEEFTVLLPLTQIDGAVILAEKIRHTIQNTAIIEGHPISMSIGVSVVQEQDEQFEEIMRRADAALYRAKQQGRNQVVVEV